jgi:hypothetical protein
MPGNRGGTQGARGRRQQVQQPRKEVVQSRASTTSNSNNEEVFEEETHGSESNGGEAGGVPRTVFGETTGEFEKGDEHTEEEEEGSSKTGTSTIVTTSSNYERQVWQNHKRTIAQQVREKVFYLNPYVQHNEEKCGLGSNFQKIVCRLSSVDGEVEQELWNRVGKREARKGLSDKRKTVTSAMQKEFKSKWHLIHAKELTMVQPQNCSYLLITWK